MPTTQHKKEKFSFDLPFVPSPHRGDYLLEIGADVSLLFQSVYTNVCVCLKRCIVDLHINGVTCRVPLCSLRFVLLGRRP